MILTDSTAHDKLQLTLIKNLQLEEWEGEGIRNSFVNKMLINCEGKPAFAELAVANKLIKDGWNAMWLTTYGKGKVSPLLLTEWKDVQYISNRSLLFEFTGFEWLDLYNHFYRKRFECIK